MDRTRGGIHSGVDRGNPRREFMAGVCGHGDPDGRADANFRQMAFIDVSVHPEARKIADEIERIGRIRLDVLSRSDFAVHNRSFQRRANDDPPIDLVRDGFFKLLDFVRTFPEQRQPVPYHGDSGLRAAVVFTRPREIGLGCLQFLGRERLERMQIARPLGGLAGNVERDFGFVRIGARLR